MVKETQIGNFVIIPDDNPNMPNNNAGVYFDVLMEHSVSVQNQITDNYLENNTAIQDHIAKSPLVVSLRGLSGELVYKPPTQALKQAYTKSNLFIQKTFNKNNPMANNNLLTDKLTLIPALLPPVDNVTQLAKNAVQYAEASIDRYKKIIDVQNFRQENRETRLRQIYKDFVKLRDANTLLYVQTPYETFINMAIQSITLRQGNQLHITDIELTLKQINYATTKTTKANEQVLAQYNATARAEVENCGKAQGVNVDNSTLLKKFVAPDAKAKRYNE